MPKPAKKTITKRKRTVKSSLLKVRKKAASSRGPKKIATSLSSSLPVDIVREQLENYSKQIDQYLNKINAKIEIFNFQVDRTRGGLALDFELRATLAR